MDLLDWGLVEYQEALLRQESLLEEIAQKQSSGALVFCQHPPIVTLGRSTKPGDVTTWSGPVLEVSRGGRATYHGPSQLVIYPIINLSIPGHSRAAKDIGAYLRNFEQAIVACLKDYGIEAEGRSLQKKSPEIEAGDETGVWVGAKKNRITRDRSSEVGHFSWCGPQRLRRSCSLSGTQSVRLSIFGDGEH